MQIEAKKMGRPRKTQEGGKNVTIYLPKKMAEKLKELGGSRWIVEKIIEELNKEEKHDQY